MRIAKLAKEAGMKYLVITAKHHDGFCLWDTETTDKKVTNSPLGKDVLAKLKKSCDKYGIKLALYFSEGDWNWIAERLENRGFAGKRVGVDMANLVMSVVNPHMCGLGGDLFALIYRSDNRRVRALDAAGFAPLKASLESYAAMGLEQMPATGIHTCTVPGALAGWQALLDEYGDVRHIYHSLGW